MYNVQSDNYLATLSSANRLLNRPDISAAIQAVQDAIRADVEYELKQELKKELLTVQRKRELLAQIATGELYVMQYYKGKDCKHCSQHVAPTINQMLRAIDLDNRLAGHYPDTKHHPKQQTTTNLKDSPPESGGEKSSQRTAECFSGQVTLAPEQKEFPSPGGLSSCKQEVRGGSLATNNPVIAGPDQLSHETSIQSQQFTTKAKIDSPPESGEPVPPRREEKSSQCTAECFSGEVSLAPELTQNTLRNDSIRATKFGSTVVP